MVEMNDQEKKKKIIYAVILVALACFSFFVIAKYASSAQVHADTIAALDEKKKVVMELTAASTAASAAITLVPGDVGTPIADKLADVSTYFLIVICVLYLEEYLLVITGYVSFAILIPVGCILLCLNLYFQKAAWRSLAFRLILFAIAFVLAVPVSVKASDLIENVYKESIEQTIDTARQATDTLQGSAKEQDTTQDDQSWWQNLVSSAKSTVSNLTNEMEQVLNHMIEALALMIVTSCVIPVLVLIFLIWLVKQALHLEGKGEKLSE